MGNLIRTHRRRAKPFRDGLYGLMGLDGRSHDILKAIIFFYTKDGLPVGSRTVANSLRLGISPATVRNVMADLEESGYLNQPHTSAGRIPTEKAYRYYVDCLLNEDLPSRERSRPLDGGGIPRTHDLRILLQDTSRALSEITHCAALVMSPRWETARFKQIEFIPLKKNQLLAISVTEEGLLQSRILEVGEDFSPKQLNRIAAFLNERYSGQSLREVQREILSQMTEVKHLYDRWMPQALELAKRAMSDLGGGELYVEGAANILDLPELTDLETIKGMLGLFQEKASILKLLDRYLETERVQVYIGSENTLLGLNHCSLVLSNYRRGNQPLGTLGVLGPIRMEYEKVIPLVSHTADRLSDMLESIV